MFEYRKILLSAALGLAGCSYDVVAHDQDEDSENSDGARSVEADPLDAPYRHVLAESTVGAENLVADAPLRGVDGAAYTSRMGFRAVREGQVEKIRRLEKIAKRPLSAEELQTLARQKAQYRTSSRVAARKVTALDKLDGNLKKRVDLLRERLRLETAPSEDENVSVSISLKKTHMPPLAVQMNQAIAQGDIETKRDYDQVAKELTADRRAVVRDAQASAVERVEALGGRVTYRAENLYLLVADMPLSKVAELAEAPEVVRVDTIAPVQADIDGIAVADGHQISQFYPDDYTGENVNGWDGDITFAQVEVSGLDDEHVGYREATGTTDRIRGMFNCNASNCSSTSGYPPSQEGDHASAVAGIIFGDLNDGQDSRYTGSRDRSKRSGYATESRGWFFRAAAETDTMTTAFDYVAGMAGIGAPAVVNVSMSKRIVDACEGHDDISKAANGVYESGKLLFNSGGNNMHKWYSCSLFSPGSALGVFTVGALGGTISGGNAGTVRDALISGTSNRGGSDYHDRSRLDMAAYGCRDRLFDDRGGYEYEGCGTSFATPTMTATAIDFIDFFKHDQGDEIDDPGLLFVNLLLMGDTLALDQTRMASRFDGVYGAGRLRARRFDNEGMDYPYEWNTGSTCISAYEDYVIPINNGNTIPSDVEILKAVIWWYDSRHDDNGTLDDIDLSLKTNSGGSLGYSVSINDNKERVVVDPGGKTVKMHINGLNVTSDTSGCGQNAMMVYWAYYFEDTDRDDGDGPGSDIDVW